MKYLKHVGGAWLLANGLHPVLFCLFFFAMGSSADFLLAASMLAFIISVFFSLLLRSIGLFLTLAVVVRYSKKFQW